jgi:type I restriction enzyme M protein
VVKGHGELAAELKEKHNNIIALYKQAGKLLRLKQDKRWSELGLIGVDTALNEAFARVCFEDEIQEVRGVLNWPGYWLACMDWLQSCFPEAKYTDVVGLCKAAERKEYAEEQDYSLNAGRYVGVVIEGEDLSEEEFKAKLQNLNKKFIELSTTAQQTEKSIQKVLGAIL